MVEVFIRAPHATMTQETSPQPEWAAPPQALRLGADDVHLWRADLELLSAHQERFGATLAADEKARAGRFHFAKDRAHFIVARGLLRHILARYVGGPPGRLQFSYTHYGKPYLSEDVGGLQFNLSHSHRIALFAITCGREIGVDVEYIRPKVVEENIAESFFSRSEVETLRALPPQAQPAAFFACWTRKEAFIKAHGEGLSLGLDQFDVTMAPGEPALLLSTRFAPQEASRWSLREINIDAGYAASLAVEGAGWQLACWQWVEE